MTAPRLRIVFFGSGAFAIPSFEALLDAGHELAALVTQPDREKGRGRALAAPPLKPVAESRRILVLQPRRIKEPAAQEAVRAFEPELSVVVAYGQILPAAVLAIPRLGAINVHASLLPRHRGAAPVARAILAGDAQTGVTIMKMDEQLDHGPILAMSATPIGEGEDSVALTARLAQMGADLLVETLDHFDELRVAGQDHSQATVAAKLRKEEGELEWDLGAVELDRRVRALQPWPGATLPTNRGRAKVLKGHVDGDRYVLDVVQLPGKKPAPARQVLGDA